MDNAEKVGRLYLQGKNENQIARELGVPRKDVVVALRDFRSLLRRSSESAVDVRDRLLDIIFEADEAFRMVIEEAWNTVRDADDQDALGVKINALKLVESSTKNRADMLQKSGVSQDDEIIEQLNETDRRQQVLVGILRKVKELYPEAAEYIARELSKVSSDVEVIEIEAGDG